MSALVDALLELIYPSRANCMGCGSPLGADEGWLCDECRDQLTPVHDFGGERCPHCGRPGKWDRLCKTCRAWPAGMIELARFAYVYRRPVDRMIRRMKYDSVYRLCDWMGVQIANMLLYEVFPEADLVVPVPMHRRRKRVRGFNHSELIARSVAAQVGLPMADALTRVRNTRQQARLSFSERRRNMEDAFAANADLSGKRVLLIDDVLTSGATAIGCARALRAAGAKQVFLATLAGALESNY